MLQAKRPTQASDLAHGVLLSACAVAVSLLLNALVPFAGPLVWAILLGAVVANTGLVPASARPGLAFVAKRVLRAGVVLLGLQLTVGNVFGLGVGVLTIIVTAVVVTFFGTLWLGRTLGVGPRTRLMIASGFSICGASAIAAMDAVTAGRETGSNTAEHSATGIREDDQQAVAVGLAMVTLFGSLAIVVLPWLGELLGLSAHSYGVWVGASVQEVAQVVAAGALVPGAVGIAVAVKLTRVLTLAPMIALTGIRQRALRDRSSLNGSEDAGSRPPLVPLFVVGFLAAVVLRTIKIFPDGILDLCKQLDTILLTAAMFALGTGVKLATLRRSGLRPLLLGALSWLVIGAVSFTGVALL